MQVLPPRNDMERQGLIVGGILNILFPCGLGTMICSCMTRRRRMLVTGVLQLITTILIVGIFWSFVHGICMLVASGTPIERRASASVDPARSAENQLHHTITVQRTQDPLQQEQHSPPRTEQSKS